MPEPTQLLGKMLIAAGAAMLLIGVLLLIAPKIPFLGKLPGDLHFRKDNLEVYVPIASGLLLSAVLTLGMWLYKYFTKT